jgi:hypothetical protein
MRDARHVEWPWRFRKARDKIDWGNASKPGPESPLRARPATLLFAPVETPRFAPRAVQLDPRRQFRGHGEFWDSSLSDLGDRSEVSGKSRIVFRSFEANGGSI